MTTLDAVLAASPAIRRVLAITRMEAHFTVVDQPPPAQPASARPAVA